MITHILNYSKSFIWKFIFVTHAFEHIVYVLNVILVFVCVACGTDTESCRGAF